MGAGVEAVSLRTEPEGTRSVCAAIEAVPADVCGNGNLDGQREAQEGEDFRPLDRAEGAAAICGEADAGASVSGVDSEGRGTDHADAAERSAERSNWFLVLLESPGLSYHFDGFKSVR